MSSFNYFKFSPLRSLLGLKWQLLAIHFLLRIGFSAADTSCVESFDIFLLQDVSETFHGDLESAISLMTNWIEGVQSKYEHSRFGYATFTDKALPLSGFGPYGGWQSAGIQFDWCYELEQPLTESVTDFESSLRRVGDRIGSGFDWPEAQLEAILRGASSADVGWNTADVSRRINVVLMITDVASHLPGDAALNIGVYNAPRTLVSAAKMRTAGGWGSHALLDTDLIAYAQRDKYEEMATYFARESWHPKGLSDEEKQNLQLLRSELGPEQWSSVAAHPGDDSLPCDEVDYPSGEQVAAQLREKDIIPIVLVVEADGDEQCVETDDGLQSLQNCPILFYEAWMSRGGLSGIVRPFPSEHDKAIAAMIQAVEDAAAIVCDVSSTAEADTRQMPSRISESTQSSASQAAVSSAADETLMTFETSSSLSDSESVSFQLATPERLTLSEKERSSDMSSSGTPFKDSSEIISSEATFPALGDHTPSDRTQESTHSSDRDTLEDTHYATTTHRELLRSSDAQLQVTRTDTADTTRHSTPIIQSTPLNSVDDEASSYLSSTVLEERFSSISLSQTNKLEPSSLLTSEIVQLQTETVTHLTETFKSEIVSVDTTTSFQGSTTLFNTLEAVSEHRTQLSEETTSSPDHLSTFHASDVSVTETKHPPSEMSERIDEAVTSKYVTFLTSPTEQSKSSTFAASSHSISSAESDSSIPFVAISSAAAGAAAVGATLLYGSSYLGSTGSSYAGGEYARAEMDGTDMSGTRELAQTVEADMFA